MATMTNAQAGGMMQPHNHHHPGGVSQSQQQQQHPSRSIQACLECRKSKLKCDGMTKQDSVCTRCKKRGKTCHWSVHLPFNGTPTSDGGMTTQPMHEPSTRYMPTNVVEQQPYNVPRSIAGPSSSVERSAAASKSYRHTSFNDSSPYETATTVSSNGPSHSTSLKRSADYQHEYGVARRRPTSPSWSHTPLGVEKREYSRSPDFTDETCPSTNPAPLVAIREVAMLSPEAEKTDVTSTDRSYDKPAPNGRDPYLSSRARHDAILAEMDALQSQSGWTRSELTDISGERRHFFERAIAGEPSSVRQHDPLEQGVITMNDAERYFEVYYESINSQHCLLDPVQDTWQSVRNRSRTLFITVVAAASCIDIRQTSIGRRTALTHSMDEAIAMVLMANAKSPDVVKALLLAYLFTQKPDRVSGDKCWLLVDTASRTAAELGLGIRLRTPQASVTNTDTYSFRNAERAWIFSQVMQRSLGTSTGLWSIGKMDVKWDKLEAWCECRDALPGDVEHVAFLFLRRLEYHARAQFEDIDAERFSTLESIRASFNALFDNWRQRWVEHPKLVKEHISRSFLLIVGLHIQLLINVTALKLAEGSKGRRTDFSRDMSPDLQPFCTRLAIDLCQTFISCFEGKAHILCRNIVSMVTWSAMALMQMEPDKGRILVLRVALMLAGKADDREYRTTLSAFFGRSLLSLVNDLTLSGPSKRHHKHGEGIHHGHQHHQSSHQHHREGGHRDLLRDSNGAGGGGRLKSGAYQFGNGTVSHVLPSSGSDTRSTAGSNSALNTPSSSVLQDSRFVHDAASDGAGSAGHAAAQLSAERMLSTMAGPLSADPYNEQWLNQFLDNLAPIAMPATTTLDERQQMLGAVGPGGGMAQGGGGAPPPPSGFGFGPPLADTGSSFTGGGPMFGNRPLY